MKLLKILIVSVILVLVSIRALIHLFSDKLKISDK